MWGLEFEPKPDSLLIYYLFDKLIGKPLPTAEMIKHLVSGKKNFPDPTFIPPGNLFYFLLYTVNYFLIWSPVCVYIFIVFLLLFLQKTSLFDRKRTKRSFLFHCGWTGWSFPEVHCSGSLWRFSSEKSVNHLHNGEEVCIGTARTFISFKNIEEEGGYEMVEYKLLNSEALGIDPRLIQSRPFNDLVYWIIIITVSLQFLIVLLILLPFSVL